MSKQLFDQQVWLTRAAVERAGGSLHLANSAGGGLAVIELPVERKK